MYINSETTERVSVEQARELYRHPNAEAAIDRGPSRKPKTKDDLLGAIDSYIDAGGEVHEYGHPRAGEPVDDGGWQTLADELSADYE